jgi:hypothetical protein
MQSPPPDPPVSDVAPADRNLTGYDEEHLVTYLRLLDADAEGADWQEVAMGVYRLLAKGSGRSRMNEDGGEGGIRTHDGLAPILVFKTSAFNHSATSP